MSKTTNSEYKIAIFGAAVSIIFTAIYDWIKAKPILYTLKSILGWIWNNIFKFELPVWQIIILLMVVLILNKILKKSPKENIEENFNDWLNYTEDSFDGLKWKWIWQKVFGKWNIENLSPICPECGTTMEQYNMMRSATCPRCDHRIYDFKSSSKIEAIIIDNVKRDLYKPL